MLIDDELYDGEQEQFLGSLVGRTIKIQLNPKNKAWYFYVVRDCKYPEMLLKVQDTWCEYKPEYIKVGDKGKFYTVAQTISIVGSDGMSFAHEAT